MKREFTAAEREQLIEWLRKFTSACRDAAFETDQLIHRLRTCHADQVVDVAAQFEATMNSVIAKLGIE